LSCCRKEPTHQTAFHQGPVTWGPLPGAHGAVDCADGGRRPFFRIETPALATGYGAHAAVLRGRAAGARLGYHLSAVDQPCRPDRGERKPARRSVADQAQTAEAGGADRAERAAA